MALNFGNQLFEDDKGGITKEERATITKDSRTIAILGHAANYSSTDYWSCSAPAFIPSNPDIDDVNYSVVNGRVSPSENGVEFTAPVFLPHGVVVTAVVIYGSISDETWTLSRAPIGSTGPTTMATANFNTADTSITNATIDNSTYRYWLETSSLDDGDDIYAAKITYTVTPSAPDQLGQVTVTGTAYSGIGDRLRGFKTVHSLLNRTGSSQTYDYNIKNLTKGTTLKTTTGKVVADGVILTGTNVWSTDEVASGDTIQFEMTNGFVGTAGDSALLGYLDWIVESIEETREAT